MSMGTSPSKDCSILLVNPCYLAKVYKSKGAPTVKPPLGLAYVASALEQAGFRIEILDANAEFLGPKETAEKIIGSGAKYIGFTSVTSTMPLVYKISSLLKNKDSNKIIFVGGPHVSFAAKQTLEDCQEIDFVVRGEGEITAVELISKLVSGENISGVDGITLRKEGRIIENQDRELINDINAITLPARHLLPINLYSPSALDNLGFKGSDYATIITTRGCPNKCVFCSSAAFWKRIRARSPENVADELEELVRQYGIKHVEFLDDTLILSAKRMEEICNLILERNLNIKWSCYARINHVTKELVDLMKKSGCRFIQLGVESGNQQVLDRVQKNITLEQVRRAAKIVRKAGVKLMCFFMIGLPGDTRETVLETIRFAKELKPNFALFCITTPFPGTSLYDEYRQLGRLKQGYIWLNMNIHESTNFSTPALSSKELEELYFKAHHQFYYRPTFIWQTIVWVLKNPYEMKNFYYLAKNQISREFRKLFKK